MYYTRSGTVSNIHSTSALTLQPTSTYTHSYIHSLTHNLHWSTCLPPPTKGTCIPTYLSTYILTRHKPILIHSHINPCTYSSHHTHTCNQNRKFYVGKSQRLLLPIRDYHLYGVFVDCRHQLFVQLNVNKNRLRIDRSLWVTCVRDPTEGDS